MAKVLVLYYSAYGHIEAMANAVAEGARKAGATVDVKRVPELVPEAVAKASHYKLDQAAPIARPAACGPRARCTARSAAPLHQRRPSTAGRKPRCSRSSPTCCISA